MQLKAWGILVAAGMLEIAWAVGIRYTQSWTRVVPSALVVASYGACLYLLSVAMKTLPAGTAYAVWVGIGTVGVTLWGIAFFGEPATAVRLACIGLILTGVIGLKLVSP